MAYVSNPYLTGSRVYNGGTNNAGTKLDYSDIARRELNRGLNLGQRMLNKRPRFGAYGATMGGGAGGQPAVGVQSQQPGINYLSVNAAAAPQAMPMMATQQSLAPTTITPEQRAAATPIPMSLNAPQATTQETATPAPTLPSDTGYQMPIFNNRTPTDSLIPPGIATANPGLPTDLDYTQAIGSAYGDYSSLAQQLLDQYNAATDAYTRQARPLEENINKLPSQLLQQMAARGLGRSSIYSDILGEQTRAGMEQSNALQEQMKNANTGYTTGLANLGINFKDQQQRALFGLAQRLGEKAGTGLGISPDLNPDLVADPGSALNTYLREQIAKAQIKPPPAAAPPETPTAPAPNPPAATPAIPKPGTPAVPKPGTPAGSKPAAPTGIFRQGSSGSSVKSIQSMLNRSGANLKVDGAFGKGTLAAVKAFQKSHGLVADGIVGPKTLAALWR